MVHNSCNMGTCGLPDIYTLNPQSVALVLWVYTSGKPLLPMLLLYNINKYSNRDNYNGNCHPKNGNDLAVKINLCGQKSWQNRHIIWKIMYIIRNMVTLWRWMITPRCCSKKAKQQVMKANFKIWLRKFIKMTIKQWLITVL